MGCRYSSSSCVPPTQFNLTRIEATAGKVKTLTFNWDKAQNAQTYTLCEKDLSIDNQCKVLATQLATNDAQQSMTHTFSELFLMPNVLKKDFFIMASNLNGETLSAEGNVNTETYLATLGFLKASNIDASDVFGSSVSLSDDGKTLAIGAPYESGGSASLPDNITLNAGAVYVFHNVNGAWGEPVYLKALNIGAGDYFGHSVSLSGDGNTLAVGARQEDSDSAATPNDNALNSGAAYVFHYENGQWGTPAHLKASNVGAGDEFGISVSLNGDGSTLAVGANFEDSSSMVTPNDSATDSGAVYVFEYENSAWGVPEYFKATFIKGGRGKEQFGISVSLSHDGKTLAVGAHRDDGTDALGTSGGPNDNFGAVYVFQNTNGLWGTPDYLKASNIGEGDLFGASVSISGDGKTLAVGASYEDSDAAIPNDNIRDFGAVYVFRYVNGQWGTADYLKASNIGSDDLFGYSVSLSADGDTLAVGAVYEDSDSTEDNDPLNPNGNASESGAVYLFHYENGLWGIPDYLKARNLEAHDQFGYSVSLSRDGRTLVVGAHYEDSSITRLNNDANASGAVYSF